MRLVIKDYLTLLKEKDELDLLFRTKPSLRRQSCKI